MEYQLKKDSVEAWRIGSEPVPDWVPELVEDKTIRGRLDGHTFSVGTDDGPKDAQTGDYLTYAPTVWGEPTEDAPQGEILAYRSVTLVSQGEFQKLYDVPTNELSAVPVDEQALIANGESARPLSEPEKDAAPEFEPQPFAAESFDSDKPKRKR